MRRPLRADIRIADFAKKCAHPSQGREDQVAQKQNRKRANGTENLFLNETYSRMAATRQLQIENKGRRFVGIELKASYWRQAVANLETADSQGRLELDVA